MDSDAQAVREIVDKLYWELDAIEGTEAIMALIHQARLECPPGFIMHPCEPTNVPSMHYDATLPDPVITTNATIDTWTPLP